MSSSISVLIAVYGGDEAAAVSSALDSISDSQTLNPIEIVIVQDGPISTSVQDVLLTFCRQSKITVKMVQIAERNGLANALNHGIEVCTGDFIARMDADDISLPNRFQIQRDFLVSSPETDLVGGSIQEFDDTHECISIRRYPVEHADILHAMAKGSPLAHPTVMFRRRVFDAGFRYDVRLTSCQDIDLWFRLAKSGIRFGNVSDTLILFRVGSSFIERRSAKKAWTEFSIYRMGIMEVHGFSWRLLFPLLRLVFRLSPRWLIRLIYSSKLRHFVLRS